MDSKTIHLEFGAEGGSLALIEQDDKFFVIMDQGTLIDFMDEEDLAGFEPVATMGPFESLSTALERLLEKYPSALKMWLMKITYKALESSKSLGVEIGDVNFKSQLTRAQGALLGQVAGDSLGSLVEFLSPSEIRRRYPDGVRELADGGTFDTLAGQPTDDSEMALLLARSLVEHGTFNAEEVLERYRFWLASQPFDCGLTIAGALKGSLNPRSQANGALMRVSPLGVFGVNYSLDQVAEWAMADAALTHPNLICQQVNALYAMAIATAIKRGLGPRDLYDQMIQWGLDLRVDPIVIDVMRRAECSPPSDFMDQMGWVLVAFQNALFQMLHAQNFESAVVDTVMRGGDTDTNAAIVGALLGAVYGRESIPVLWQTAILSCRPKFGGKGVHRPRPECFWPVDVLELAEKLVLKD